MQRAHLTSPCLHAVWTESSLLPNRQPCPRSPTMRLAKTLNRPHRCAFCKASPLGLHAMLQELPSPNSSNNNYKNHYRYTCLNLLCMSVNQIWTRHSSPQHDLILIFRRIVQQRMSILHRSERMKFVLPEPSIIAFKRQRNLADILVHSKTNKTLRRKMCSGSYTCGKNCSVCPLIIATDKLQSSDKKKEFNITSHVDCESDNVVYAIVCRACDKTVYVGETNRRLKDRIIEHRSSISTKKEFSVAIHFNSDDYCLKDMQVIGIERSRMKKDIYRRKREKLWMKLLLTVKPEGLNDKT